MPEFVRGELFTLGSTKPIDEFLGAKAIGVHTRPVLLGPITYLTLGKTRDETLDRLSLLPALLPIYIEILRRLAIAGADWIQVDEPALLLDLDGRVHDASEVAFAALSSAAPSLKLLLTTYFGAMEDDLETALRLPVAGLHLDLIRGAGQFGELLAKASS